VATQGGPLTNNRQDPTKNTKPPPHTQNSARRHRRQNPKVPDDATKIVRVHAPARKTKRKKRKRKTNYVFYM